MPFQYARDDTTRRIRTTLSDPLTVDELIALVEHQLADGTWRYGMIIDARSVALFTFKPVEMQLFVARVRDRSAAHGPRGPVAVVSRHSPVISGSTIYKSFGGKAEVFWDMDEAQRFLDQWFAQNP